MRHIAAVLFLLASLTCLPSLAQQRNGLPPTRMDSFVWEAGMDQADLIYGDEGALDIPPYFGFVKAHRINEGIHDVRDRGLTTGHGSYMPDAWGADEFLAPPGEWSQSGANGGNRRSNNAAAALDQRARADYREYRRSMPDSAFWRRPVPTAGQTANNGGFAPANPSGNVPHSTRPSPQPNNSGF